LMHSRDTHIRPPARPSVGMQHRLEASGPVLGDFMRDSWSVSLLTVPPLRNTRSPITQHSITACLHIERNGRLWLCPDTCLGQQLRSFWHLTSALPSIGPLTISQYSSCAAIWERNSLSFGRHLSLTGSSASKCCSTELFEELLLLSHTAPVRKVSNKVQASLFLIITTQTSVHLDYLQFPSANK
jgi:hypothetical protein